MSETGLDSALKEVEDAIAFMEAAISRLHEATANLMAAQLIEQSKGPL